jgi:hypothetical protein
MLPCLAEMSELVPAIRIQTRVGGTLWDRALSPPLSFPHRLPPRRPAHDLNLGRRAAAARGTNRQWNRGRADWHDLDMVAVQVATSLMPCGLLSKPTQT